MISLTLSSIMMRDDLLGPFELMVMAAILRLGKDAYGMKIRLMIEEETGRSVAIGSALSSRSEERRVGKECRL